MTSECFSLAPWMVKQEQIPSSVEEHDQLAYFFYLLLFIFKNIDIVQRYLCVLIPSWLQV